MIRRSLCSLLLPALFVVCAQAQAQNATGEPAVTAADGTNLTTTGPNEDNALTAAQGTIGDTADGLTVFTPTWQWSQADAPVSGTPTESAYIDITNTTSTEAMFTPLQVHVGKFIRACATFEDDASNSETRCWSSVAAVVNVDDLPVAQDNTIEIPLGTASYAFSSDDFTFFDEDDDDIGGVVIETQPATALVLFIVPLGLSGGRVIMHYSLTSEELTAQCTGCPKMQRHLLRAMPALLSAYFHPPSPGATWPPSP